MCCIIPCAASICGMFCNFCSLVFHCPSGERHIPPAPPLVYFDRPDDPNTVETPAPLEDPFPSSPEPSPTLPQLRPVLDPPLALIRIDVLVILMWSYHLTNYFVLLHPFVINDIWSCLAAFYCINDRLLSFDLLPCTDLLYSLLLLFVLLPPWMCINF